MDVTVGVEMVGNVNAVQKSVQMKPLQEKILLKSMNPNALNAVFVLIHVLLAL